MKTLLLLLLAASLLSLYLTRRNAEADRRQCEENLGTIATALEMYSSSTPCRYPPSLSYATFRQGGYLKTFPTCPAAGYDTYSPTYESATLPDVFTVSCGGLHHGSVHLVYSAEEGLTRKPVQLK